MSESKTNTDKTYKDIDSEDQSNPTEENGVKPLDDSVEKAIELFRKVREGGNVDLTEKKLQRLIKSVRLLEIVK